MTWDEEIAAHRRALDTSFAVFRRTPHEALLWLTTVVAAYVVTIHDDIRVPIRAAVKRYDSERTAAYQRSGRTYRSPRGWTRFCGAIEIDLIHPRIARMCSRTKAGLLAELGIDASALRDDQRIVLLHEHAIIDHRGHASEKAFKRDLRQAWPGKRRIHGKRLYTEGTVAKNLRNLAEYSGKFRLVYALAWDDRKTSYLRSGEYELEWRDYVRALYRAIGVSRLLNSNITLQGCKAGMHTDRPVFRGETVADECFQLPPSRNKYNDDEDMQTNSSNHNTHPVRLADDDGETMKATEIASYLSPEQIMADAMRDLDSALVRQGPGLTPEELVRMYGDEERDLRMEQKRLDAAKTRAEIDRLRAAAALDRADAHRNRATSVCGCAHNGSSPTPASEAPSVRPRSPAWLCEGPGQLERHPIRLRRILQRRGRLDIQLARSGLGCAVWRPRDLGWFAPRRSAAAPSASRRPSRSG